jgi:hypothetical protein
MTAISRASIRLGFSLPSMNPVRSRSWRYGQLEVSSAIDPKAFRVEIASRAMSKTTSYALPESQRTASCCVAGIA